MPQSLNSWSTILQTTSLRVFLILFQEKRFMINLPEIKHMRATRPKKQGKLGMVHIDYGSSGRTKKVTITVQQVRHRTSIILRYPSFKMISKSR